MLDLARALATGPRLLVVDELAAGLNPAELEWVAGKLKELARTGMAIIVVEHLMGFIEQMTDRVIVHERRQGDFRRQARGGGRACRRSIEVFLGGEHAA